MLSICTFTRVQSASGRCHRKTGSLSELAHVTRPESAAKPRALFDNGRRLFPGSFSRCEHTTLGFAFVNDIVRNARNELIEMRGLPHRRERYAREDYKTDLNQKALPAQ